jgi:diguanylate cyclase (GGDEF)-like protein
MGLSRSVGGLPSTAGGFMGTNASAAEKARVRERDSLAASRASRILVTLLILSVGAFMASVYLRPAGEVQLPADVGLYNAPLIIAGVLAARRGLTGGHSMRPWLVLAAGLFLYVVGNILYTLAEPLGIDLGPPSLPDVFWISFYPCAFVAVLLLTHRRIPTRTTYAWLDSLVVGTGAFAVGTAVLGRVIEGGAEGQNVADVVLNSLSLLGDLVLMALVATVIQAFNGRPPAAWWFLLAGFMALAAGDALFLVQEANGDYVEGGWLDALWPVSAAFIGLAAWLDRVAALQTPRWRKLSFLGPSAAILAAGGVLMARVTGVFETVATLAAFSTIVLAVVRLNVDVHQSLLLARQLRRSRIDSLTGLLNRRGFLDVDTVHSEGCALILLDLDAFKDVNETLSHDVGDRLLRTAAERLTEGVRATDVLARLGGDEFGVLVWGAESRNASAIAESLIVSLERPLVLDGVPLVVTACAGVAVSEDGIPDLTLMLRQAEVALYAAKADGPGLVRTHDLGAGEQSAARLRIRAEVRADLASGGGRFVIHYQPIMAIKDGTLLAVEALVRWQHDGGLVAPDVFLPEVIRGGQMADLTILMLKRSLREVKGLPVSLPVTVNVPPELMTDWILLEVEGAIAAANVDGGRLIIEITEEAIMKNPEEVGRVLLALRSRGIRTLLDDFGTGWAGLASLRDLIVDGLKIDRSFVSAVTSDSTAQAIVHGVVRLADELGVLVVCEGAEDDEVMSALAEFDRGYVQGFAAARPMPIDDLARWIGLHPVGVHEWPDPLQFRGFAPDSAAAPPEPDLDVGALPGRRSGAVAHHQRAGGYQPEAAGWRPLKAGREHLGDGASQ